MKKGFYLELNEIKIYLFPFLAAQKCRLKMNCFIRKLFVT